MLSTSIVLTVAIPASLFRSLLYTTLWFADNMDEGICLSYKDFGGWVHRHVDLPLTTHMLNGDCPLYIIVVGVISIQPNCCIFSVTASDTVHIFMYNLTYEFTLWQVT